MKQYSYSSSQQNESQYQEKVVSLDRISRTVKGGRRIRFRALVIIGDGKGTVGLAMAKGADVQKAVAKARAQAVKTLITVPIVDGTIAYPIEETCGSTKVVLKPARAGHSVIAGGAVRPVLELAGIQNIVSKSLGSTNAYNNAMATYNALIRLSKIIPRKSNG